MSPFTRKQCIGKIRDIQTHKWFGSREKTAQFALFTAVSLCCLQLCFTVLLTTVFDSAVDSCVSLCCWQLCFTVLLTAVFHCAVYSCVSLCCLQLCFTVLLTAVFHSAVDSCVSLCCWQLFHSAVDSCVSLCCWQLCFTVLLTAVFHCPAASCRYLPKPQQLTRQIHGPLNLQRPWKIHHWQSPRSMICSLTDTVSLTVSTVSETTWPPPQKCP